MQYAMFSNAAETVFANHELESFAVLRREEMSKSTL